MSIKKNEFYEYQIRLARALMEKALSCEDISNDADAKEFIFNFVQSNMIDNKIINDIQRIVYRLSNMAIDRNGKDAKVKIEYPIVNKYKGHELMGSYYFIKEDGQYKEIYIETKQSVIKIN